MKLHLPIIACLLAALPAAAFADPHNDHNSRQSAPAARQSYQSSRSYQQAPREAQRYNAQPVQRYNAQPEQRFISQPEQRYNTQPVQRFNPQPEQRYSQPLPRYQARTEDQRTYVQSRTYVQRNNYAYGGRGYAAPHFVAVRRDVNPWYWNRGLAWAPSREFWGGGFWGAFAINLAFNEPAPANYYYQVAPSSPGSQLLANYGLTQTDCNQPNLVDITGPDGSEICAYPNDQVGPGQYNVDPSTLSLVSE